MASEWTEAYVDYDGLKSILQQILHYKLSKQPETHLRSLNKKLSLHRTLSGLHLHHGNEGDVEDQVKEVDKLQKDDSGSGHEFYKTKSLGESGEGGEIEVEFFRKLDEELNKVNTFYKEKVEEVMDEAALLNKQMDALIALRFKVQSSDGNGACLKKHPSADILNTTSEEMGFNDSISEVEMSGKSSLEESSNSHNGSGNMGENLQRNNNQDEESASDPEFNPLHNIQQSNGNQEAKNPLEVLEGVKITNTLDSPMSTIKGIFKDSKHDELCFEKAEVKKVEERLREVFIEFYQKLRLLKHFSFMNLSALSKIMQSYEKITSRRAARSYMNIVDNSYIGSSDEINNLLERVEATFIKHFSNSNIKEGMKSLRPKVRKEKHSVTFYSGFFFGFAIALLIAVVLRIETKNVMDKEGASYMVNIFPLYSFFAYIVLHMLMYSADIYFWRRYRINYAFIFGFKQGTELGYREVFLLSTGLAVLVLACFLGNLHLDLASKSQNLKTLTGLFPLALVAIVLVILFCPIDIIYRSTRFFFIKSLFHCLCAPLYKVTLPDFFLADNITSQIQAIRSLDLYICYYGLGELSRRESKCHGHGAYNVLYFAVAVIPFWLRFLQCLRRVFEEKDGLQGYNALTYFMNIVAVLIRTAFELKKGTTWLVLALLSSAVAVIINTYWDLVVDWGLLRRHSKNVFLRDKLLVPYKSVYFGAMALNIVLRVAWMQLVLEFNLHSLHKVAITTVISCLEIIRRGIWNFFRIENEHLNNVGKYRAFKSVPLPFNYDDEDSKKGD
ncbi:hypothetical protein CCACVL1_06554 [Corchorus capsularis]|uniref:SPX domain-containing protein n=1 Tax=Corchorus capsularis TaxID=210143 RepID=A0A1R3JEL4_COCAP|nr:hypothetical protein CCACVL1_06554 [Corchorus capsularis]